VFSYLICERCSLTVLHESPPNRAIPCDDCRQEGVTAGMAPMYLLAQHDSDVFAGSR
jgi:hypothetical protein